MTHKLLQGTGFPDRVSRHAPALSRRESLGGVLRRIRFDSHHFEGSFTMTIAALRSLARRPLLALGRFCWGRHRRSRRRASSPDGSPIRPTATPLVGARVVVVGTSLTGGDQRRWPLPDRGGPGGEPPGSRLADRLRLRHKVGDGGRPGRRHGGLHPGADARTPSTRSW